SSGDPLFGEAKQDQQASWRDDHGGKRPGKRINFSRDAPSDRQRGPGESEYPVLCWLPVISCDGYLGYRFSHPDRNSHQGPLCISYPVYEWQENGNEKATRDSIFRTDNLSSQYSLFPERMTQLVGTGLLRISHPGWNCPQFA